jgi:hypothetical protein
MTIVLMFYNYLMLFVNIMLKNNVKMLFDAPK